jgi:hypothetical protein
MLFQYFEANAATVLPSSPHDWLYGAVNATCCDSVSAQTSVSLDTVISNNLSLRGVWLEQCQF